MRYSHLLFDLDGTLVNSEQGITNSVAYALSSFGITVTDKSTLRPFIGPPLVDSFMKYYDFSIQEAKRAVEEYRVYYRKSGIMENELYPGVKETLYSLRSYGAELWLATSKPTVFAKQILEHMKIDDLFSHCFGAELDGSRDSKESVIGYALQAQGILDTEDFLMVGDRFYDIVGAHAHGIDAAAVLYGFGSFEEFKQYRADYIIEAPTELLNICAN